MVEICSHYGRKFPFFLGNRGRAESLGNDDVSAHAKLPQVRNGLKWLALLKAENDRKDR